MSFLGIHSNVVIAQKSLKIALDYERMKTSTITPHTFVHIVGFNWIRSVHWKCIWLCTLTHVYVFNPQIEYYVCRFVNKYTKTSKLISEISVQLLWKRIQTFQGTQKSSHSTHGIKTICKTISQSEFFRLFNLRSFFFQVCPFCEKSFANGSNCRSHKKKAHPVELAQLEASGEVLPSANIPKLEHLQPKYIKEHEKIANWSYSFYFSESRRYPILWPQ